MRDDRGQALVETLWLVPLVAAVVAACVATGAWLMSSLAAHSAAEAAAIASIQGRDPRAAARDALPAWAAGKVTVGPGGRTVSADVVPGHTAGVASSVAGADFVIRLPEVGR